MSFDGLHALYLRNLARDQGPEPPWTRCPACHGTGRTPIAYPVANEAMALADAPACPACDGTGEAADP